MGRCQYEIANKVKCNKESEFYISSRQLPAYASSFGIKGMVCLCEEHKDFVLDSIDLRGIDAEKKRKALKKLSKKEYNKKKGRNGKIYILIYKDFNDVITYKAFWSKNKAESFIETIDKDRLIHFDKIILE